MSAELKFWGEGKCEAKMQGGRHQGLRCIKKAYYSQGQQVLCGMHSSAGKRKPLGKNPEAKVNAEKMAEDLNKSIQRAEQQNAEEGKPGSVRCTKLRMMSKPENINGFMKVFPNFKHQNRKDGFGCKSLSPKSLGPIEHRQPGLPVCKNLENFHQFNKVHPSELDASQSIKKNFYSSQKLAYNDSTAHRHKEVRKIDGKRERPRFSVLYGENGKQYRYTYVQSRYLYCYFYEQLAKKEKDFKTLQSMLKSGRNLQIVGYDGFDVTPEGLSTAFTDTRRSFGHEMALYTMLVINDCKNYPWNIYYHKNKQLYPEYFNPDLKA